MATNILMPALSPTMTEGTLSRWLKKEGEQVKAGDIIAEIETDKATMEVEAVDEGVLGKILVPDGTAGVKVNAPIAVLVDDGESVQPAPPPPPGPRPLPPRPNRRKPQHPPRSPPAKPEPLPALNGRDHSRIFASPLARRMAKQAGIDLSALKGSGPNGRIVRADIEAAQSAPAEPRPAAAAPAPAPAAPKAPVTVRRTSSFPTPPCGKSSPAGSPRATRWCPISTSPSISRSTRC